MDNVINRILLVLLCLIWGSAEANPTYYEKTTIPPTIETYTILCNNTAAVAAPIRCKFSGGSTTGNMFVGLSNYDPTTGSGNNNVFNTGFGVGVLNAITTGNGDIAVGYNALSNATTASLETAIGKYALRDDVEGQFNTAFGSAALRCFTGTGVKTGNVALGHGAMAGDDALCANTVGGSPNTGGGNTALGAWSGQEITTGIFNVLVGDSAGLDLTTGSTNIAVGAFSGCAPTTLDTAGQACAGVQQSIAVGYHALRFNQSNAIIGIGYEALGANTTGTQNVALGFQALSTATAGVGSTAIGYDALLTENGAGLNTAVGANTGKVISTGTLNTYIGANAGFSNQSANSDTGVGTAALTLATGGSNTAVGDHAGASLTTGNSNLFIGKTVGSTTCTSCSGNILIGLDNTTDTVANNTTHTLQIRGVSPGAAVITATAINTSTPPVAMPGRLTVGGLTSTASIIPSTTAGIVGTAAADLPTAGSVGEVASIHCVVGTAAQAATAVTITIATPAVVTWTSHTFVPSSGLANYTCPINFTGTPPTGIAVGTNYYIIGSTVSGDTFQIADTSAHALAGTNKINTTGSDGGTTAYIGNLATTNNVFPAAGLSLVAGDWDCTELAEYQELTTLTVSRWAHGINPASGTALGSIGTFQDNRIVSGAVGAFNQYQTGPVVQENISATTTVFQTVSASFTVGTMNIGGFLRCRRMR